MRICTPNGDCFNYPEYTACSICIMDSDNVLKILSDFSVFQRLKISTSGSTGKPKSIELSAEIIKWSAKNTLNKLQLKKDEKVYLPLTIDKIGGCMLLLRSYIYNWNVQLTNPTSNPMLELDTLHNLTLTSLVPLQLKTILDHSDSRKKLSRFKNIILGGSEIREELMQQLINFSKTTSCVFWHGYGMTETASHIALKKIKNGIPEPYFVPQNGVSLSLDDRGCLIIEIESLNIKEYSNDLAILHENSFEIIGRIDDVINSGSLKTHPLILQKKLELKHSFFKHYNYFFYGIDDQLLGQKIAIIIEQSSQIDIQKLILSIKDCLPSYEQPKSYYIIDKMKYKQSGKIDKIASLKAAVLFEIGG